MRAEWFASGKGFGYVGVILEAEMHDDAGEAVAQRLHFKTVLHGHVGDVFGDDGKEYHFLVQHLVVGKVMQQGVGHALAARGKKDRGTGDAHRWMGRDRRQKGSQRHRLGAQAGYKNFAAFFPCRQDGEDDGGDDQGKPAAVSNFQGSSAEECKVDHKKQQHDRRRGSPVPVQRKLSLLHRSPVPAPQRAHHNEGEDSVDRHGSGYSDTVSGGQVARRFKTDH